jgi:hypothetical protein
MSLAWITAAVACALHTQRARMGRGRSEASAAGRMQMNRSTWRRPVIKPGRRQKACLSCYWPGSVQLAARRLEAFGLVTLAVFP